MGLRRYLLVIAAGNLLWEIAHLPLYTLWKTGTWREIVFAVVHCTAGDLLIATSSLVVALVCLGDGWPEQRRVFVRVGLLALALGLVYTAYSEWLNVEVRKSWAYSAWMPVLPVLGTGLSPLAQWLIIPALGFLGIHCKRLRTSGKTSSPAGSGC